MSANLRKKVPVLRSKKEVSDTVVTVGSGDENVDFDSRVLLSLVFDFSILREQFERVQVQVHALSKRHGIDPEKV